jgi:hypothetical protein
MSKVRPGQGRHGPRGIVRAALLCAGAAALGLPGFASAQQLGTLLRGEVDETATTSDLLGGRLSATDPQTTAATQAGEGATDQAYQPASEGALPDTDTTSDAGAQPGAATKSIFDDDDGNDASDQSGASSTTPALSTARARAAARRQASQPEASAAGKRAADLKKKQAAGQTEEETDTATTGTVRARTIDSETELKARRDQEREEAVEGLDKKPEDDPYAPVGIQVGTFVVTPTAESGLTWTSNADSSTTGESALLSETTLRLNAISEWGGDKTTFDGFGNFRKTISGQEIKELRAGADAALERDLGHEWKALASLGYETGPESASSPVTITGTLEEPIKQTVTGSLGIEKQVGKVELRLTGNVEREVFGDAELVGGGTVSQSDRDSTLGTLVLRTGYEITPALTPFVELEYGKRRYDEALDSNGFARSATRTGARGGLEIDLGEKFKGELAAGWLEEALDDDRLPAVSGPTFDASLDWSPLRGTNVNLLATTEIEGATDAGDSGDILHSVLLTVTRQMRANLTGDIALGAGLRDYTGIDGRDTIWSAEAGMTWWLNRYVGLSGKVRHEQQESTLPDRDYKAESIFLGLKLQR